MDKVPLHVPYFYQQKKQDKEGGTIMQFRTDEGIVYTVDTNANRVMWNENGLECHASYEPGSMKAIVGDFGGFQIAGRHYVKTGIVEEAGIAVSQKQEPDLQQTQRFKLLGYDIPQNATIEFNTASNSHYIIDMENKVMLGGKLRMPVGIRSVSDFGDKRIMVELQDGKVIIPNRVDTDSLVLSDRKFVGEFAHTPQEYMEAVSMITDVSGYMQQPENEQVTAEYNSYGGQMQECGVQEYDAQEYDDIGDYEH